MALVMRGVSGSRTPAKIRLLAELSAFGLIAVDLDVGSCFSVVSMAYPCVSRPWRGPREPAFESHRADSPGGAGGHQRLIVQFGAEIARVNIRRHLARIFAVTQNATDKLVQSNLLGACYLEQAIDRWAEHEVSQGGDDIA